MKGLLLLIQFLIIIDLFRFPLFMIVRLCLALKFTQFSYIVQFILTQSFLVVQIYLFFSFVLSVVMCSLSFVILCEPFFFLIQLKVCWFLFLIILKSISFMSWILWVQHLSVYPSLSLNLWKYFFLIIWRDGITGTNHILINVYINYYFISLYFIYFWSALYYFLLFASFRD